MFLVSVCVSSVTVFDGSAIEVVICSSFESDDISLSSSSSLWRIFVISWIWFAIHLVGLKGSWSFFSRFFVTCCFGFLGVEDDTAEEWAVEVRERKVEGKKKGVADSVVGLAVGEVSRGSRFAKVGERSCLDRATDAEVREGEEGEGQGNGMGMEDGWKIVA